MKRTLIIYIIIFISALVLTGCTEKIITDDAVKINQQQTIEQSNNSTVIQTYDPIINPTDFSAQVNNKYFTLTPGTKYIFEGETEDGKERNEVYVTNETKEILGVKTIIVWDRVWLNDELTEETYDWYAQDKEGNVWYFGEDSKEMLDGKVVSTGGSWQAGINEAKPGIIMKGNPIVGDSYRQEYYRGEAEDMAGVISLNEKVTVPYGNFSNCLKTRDWTPLEPGADEYKYYCPEVGGVALEMTIDDGEKSELINITNDLNIKPFNQTINESLQYTITEEQAKEIAIKEVPGIVTDIAIERKFSKIAYVVEIDANNGPETDVIIDANTGEVLSVET